MVQKDKIDQENSIDLLKDLPEEELKKILQIDSLDNIESVKKEILEEPKKEILNIEPLGKDGKKRRGPKVKWTPERIEDYKKVLKEEKERKKKERQQVVANIKQTHNIPLSREEKKRIIETTIKTKDSIQNEIIKKRTILKGLQETSLSKSNCKHLYQFKYFEAEKLVTSCKWCSELKIFESREWDLYNKFVIGGDV